MSGISDYRNSSSLPAAIEPVSMDIDGKVTSSSACAESGRGKKRKSPEEREESNTVSVESSNATTLSKRQKQNPRNTGKKIHDVSGDSIHSVIDFLNPKDARSLALTSKAMCGLVEVAPFWSRQIKRLITSQNHSIWHVGAYFPAKKGFRIGSMRNYKKLLDLLSFQLARKFLDLIAS